MTHRIQLSFSKGEIAPSLHARADTTAYATGLATCRNQTVNPHGGLSNRPGTEFLYEVKDSTKAVRLIEFVFNDEQTYVIEVGDQYMRFYKDGVRITVSSVTAWSSGTAYTVGSLASRLGVNYYCILAHTGQQPPNATYWYALTDDIFEIPTPYVEADLPTLVYFQSADVLTIVHKNYAPRDLARTADTGWTLTVITFGASIDGPSIIGPTTSTPSLNDYFWSVTSVKDGEESVIEGLGRSNTAPTSSVPITISWNAVSGADSYRVYKRVAGVYGFIGPASETSFNDDGIEPDLGDNPPENPGLFAASGDYPSCGGYAQQSMFLASTTNAPSTIWKSLTGFRKNFNVKIPIVDSSPVIFSLSGQKVNKINHLIEADVLVALTSGGETPVYGDQAGVIRPTDINARQLSFNGCNTLRPIPADLLLYVQARGSFIRGQDFSVGTNDRGTNMGLFSSHLFNGYTIVDWAYQREPHSTVWAVRSDGALLGLTFIKNQEMQAWHRHDTDGTVENVCVVPEETEDRLYMVVNRTIDEEEKRYIERLHLRDFDDVRTDAIFLDASFTYDGRNTDTTRKMTLLSPTLNNWGTDDPDLRLGFTLNGVSTNFFDSDDLGEAFEVTGPNDEKVIFTVSELLSGDVARGSPNRIVPESMRAVALSTWARQVSEIEGLDHLNGKDVSIFADGIVVASPNNTKDDVVSRTVEDGFVQFDRARSVAHIGLPYVSDVETLAIPQPTKKTLITAVELQVQDTRRTFMGLSEPDDDTVDGLAGIFDAEGDDSLTPPDLFTGKKIQAIAGNWQRNGQVFIRHVDPTPQEILSITPVGQIGGQP